MDRVTNPIGVVIVQADGRAAIDTELVVGMANALSVTKYLIVVVLFEKLFQAIQMPLELGFRGVPPLLKEFRARLRVE